MIDSTTFGVGLVGCGAPDPGLATVAVDFEGAIVK